MGPIPLSEATEPVVRTLVPVHPAVSRVTARVAAPMLRRTGPTSCRWLVMHTCYIPLLGRGSTEDAKMMMFMQRAGPAIAAVMCHDVHEGSGPPGRCPCWPPSAGAG